MSGFGSRSTLASLSGLLTVLDDRSGLPITATAQATITAGGGWIRPIPVARFVIVDAVRPTVRVSAAGYLPRFQVLLPQAGPAGHASWSIRLLPGPDYPWSDASSLLRGRVVCASSGAGLDAVAVTLRDPAGVTASGESDRDGRFSVGYTAPEADEESAQRDVSVTFAATGYLPETLTIGLHRFGTGTPPVWRSGLPLRAALHQAVDEA